MKTEDLRLGNLLMIDGQVTEVWGLDLGGVNGLVDRYDSMVTNYPKTVEPIALTEEWLKRLGFERDKYREGIFEKGRLRMYGGNSYLIEEDTTLCHWIPNNIEYVHQLQNLYYALTGQELELVKTIA